MEAARGMASGTARGTAREASGAACEADMPDDALREALATIVGVRNVLIDDIDRAPHDAEQRGAYPGRSAFVVRPGSTDEVARVVSLAARRGRSIVPQGGNTGLVGGGVARGDASTPDAEGRTGAGRDIVLALGRMDAVRDLDAAGGTMVVEAGCVLDRVREAADGADRLFPLALGSGGSAQIGGLVSTNAGGMGVLAYGNTRDLVLGLEVVMPDGRVWDGLTRLRKNNTGYDLKHLFIGGEGTLGVVTAAALRLFPKPRGIEVAFAGFASPAAGLALFETLRSRAGAQLTMFELIARTPVAMAMRHRGHREPLAAEHPWYALVEISSGRSPEDARGLMEAALGEALEAGTIDDAALAGSLAQAGAFRALREDCAWAQREEGGSIKHDISVPVHAVPTFIERAAPIVESVVPGARVVCFGHMGDGNLHYNVSQPVDWEKSAFLERYEAMNDAVFALVLELGGSISAEHGIGQQKRARLPAIKPAVEIDAMRAIKRALDPRGTMNPGKLL